VNSSTQSLEPCLINTVKSTELLAVIVHMDLIHLVSNAY
jgi:hypothetical protein